MNDEEFRSEPHVALLLALMIMAAVTFTAAVCAVTAEREVELYRSANNRHLGDLVDCRELRNRISAHDMDVHRILDAVVGAHVVVESKRLFVLDLPAPALPGGPAPEGAK